MLSVSASWTISYVSPSNTFPTFRVTLSLGVNAFETLFFATIFAGGTITTSEWTSCTPQVLTCVENSALPNSARRISSSVNFLLMRCLEGSLCENYPILSAWPTPAVSSDSVENGRPWFPWVKSTTLRLKSSLAAEAFELIFHIAACQKGSITDQSSDSLRQPHNSKKNGHLRSFVTDIKSPTRLASGTDPCHKNVPERIEFTPPPSQSHICRILCR
ncbi:hypothetical protein D3C85_1206490 [compost metagenome]